jgi:hypothetical protein
MGKRYGTPCTGETLTAWPRFTVTPCHLINPTGMHSDVRCQRYIGHWYNA